MNIREIRKSLGMTQAEFAAAIGVDKSVVYKYEHGLLYPSRKRQEKIDYLVSLGGKATVVVEAENFESEAGKGRIVDAYIRRLLIMGSSGCCELCGAKAPFLDKDERPYLCVYIVDKDSEEDITRRSVVLCPNCHAKVNVLADEEEINTLKKKAAEHNY